MLEGIIGFGDMVVIVDMFMMCGCGIYDLKFFWFNDCCCLGFVEV